MHLPKIPLLLQKKRKINKKLQYDGLVIDMQKWYDDHYIFIYFLFKKRKEEARVIN